ncbi:FimD/PapC N-terminal domain-containing protein [Escherichia coli]
MTAFRAAFKAYRMHQVLLLPRFARLTIALGLATAVFPVDAEYYFNPRFLSNDLAESVDLSAFTKGREAPPGTYRIDIYLNDEFMATSITLRSANLCWQNGSRLCFSGSVGRRNKCWATKL